MIDRVNTGDNTPGGGVYGHRTGQHRSRFLAGGKGFGSENMSAIRMLTPSAWHEGGQAVYSGHRTTAPGPNPCPSHRGGNRHRRRTFDKAAQLAKKAALRCRSTDQPPRSPGYAALEQEASGGNQPLWATVPPGLGGNYHRSRREHSRRIPPTSPACRWPSTSAATRPGTKALPVDL